MKEGCVHEGGVCTRGRGVYTREGCVHEGGVCTRGRGVYTKVACCVCICVHTCVYGMSVSISSKLSNERLTHSHHGIWSRIVHGSCDLR